MSEKKMGQGPGPMNNIQPAGTKGGKNTLKSLGKVIAYVLKEYKLACLFVVIGIVVSALATLVMTLFMQTLIDDYILPLVGSASPDFSPLAAKILKLAAVLAAGILCSYGYNRIMVTVSQGTLKRLRISLFERMESLPIKYFDTHAHGDIMSVYTNDVDTLRQMISQSMPQIINSLMTLVSTFISMIVLDIPLTLISVVMVGIMLRVTSKLSALSGRYFVEQQHDLGEVNGYIEEMMEGQKVVKVFCHEEQALEDFKKLNRKLRESAKNANGIANITMPINANLGNICYVLCAVIGAILALNGFTELTIGTLVAFLNLNKSFTMPVTQLSQQLASIIMASAGAERVFSMMEEEPEKDEGYVELVRAKEDGEGNLIETTAHTGIWAWRHPHAADGTVTYQKL